MGRVVRSDGTGEGPEVRQVADLIGRGRVVAFPTETVFALAASADDPDALARLRRVKGRPGGRPFALLIADVQDVDRYADASSLARRLMAAFWPGPLTLVLPAGDGRGTENLVGLRLPDHALARAIVRACPGRLAATSANRSGEPPALGAGEVAALFGQDVALVVEDPSTPLGTASTVIRIDDHRWEILRAGHITERDIRRVLHSARQR